MKDTLLGSNWNRLTLGLILANAVIATIILIQGLTVFRNSDTMHLEVGIGGLVIDLVYLGIFYLILLRENAHLKTSGSNTYGTREHSGKDAVFHGAAASIGQPRHREPDPPANP